MLDLMNVTKTQSITTKELAAAWKNSKGVRSWGNQYDNLDSHHFLVAVTQVEIDMCMKQFGDNTINELFNNFYFTLFLRSHAVTNLTEKFDGGWVSHGSRAQGNTRTETTPNRMPEGDLVIIRCFKKYGSKDFTNNEIVARANHKWATVFARKLA